MNRIFFWGSAQLILASICLGGVPSKVTFTNIGANTTKGFVRVGNSAAQFAALDFNLAAVEAAAKAYFAEADRAAATKSVYDKYAPEIIALDSMTDSKARFEARLNLEKKILAEVESETTAKNGSHMKAEGNGPRAFAYKDEVIDWEKSRELKLSIPVTDKGHTVTAITDPLVNHWDKFIGAYQVDGVLFVEGGGDTAMPLYHDGKAISFDSAVAGRNELDSFGKSKQYIDGVNRGTPTQVAGNIDLAYALRNLINKNRPGRGWPIDLFTLGAPGFLFSSGRYDVQSSFPFSMNMISGKNTQMFMNATLGTNQEFTNKTLSFGFGFQFFDRHFNENQIVSDEDYTNRFRFYSGPEMSRQLSKLDAAGGLTASDKSFLGRWVSGIASPKYFLGGRNAGTPFITGGIYNYYYFKKGLSGLPRSLGYQEIALIIPLAKTGLKIAYTQGYNPNSSFQLVQRSFTVGISN